MSEIDELEHSRAPLLDHLIELRRRLIYCILALIVTFFACFYFSEPIFGFLLQPLKAAGQSTVIYTQIFEAFFVQVRVAFFAAMMLSFPIIANQLWQFVAPGLYKKEKRALLPFLVATPILFLCGAAMAYFIAVPMALHFLLSFQGDVGGVHHAALGPQAQLGAHGTEVLAVTVGQGQGRAGARERLRHRAAQVARGSGNQHHLPVGCVCSRHGVTSWLPDGIVAGDRGPVTIVRVTIALSTIVLITTAWA